MPSEQPLSSKPPAHECCCVTTDYTFVEGMPPMHKMHCGTTVFGCSAANGQMRCVYPIRLSVHITTATPFASRSVCAALLTTARWSLAGHHPRASVASASCSRGREAGWERRVAAPRLWSSRRDRPLQFAAAGDVVAGPSLRVWSPISACRTSRTGPILVYGVRGGTLPAGVASPGPAGDVVSLRLVVASCYSPDLVSSCCRRW